MVLNRPFLRADLPGPAKPLRVKVRQTFTANTPPAGSLLQAAFSIMFCPFLKQSFLFSILNPSVKVNEFIVAL
jgi:hypothetical protein